MRSDRRFIALTALVGGSYALFLVLLLVALIGHTRPSLVSETIARPEVRYALVLSLASTTTSTLLAMVVAVPLGYLLSRGRFPGRQILDAIIDVPLVLPPLVVGLALLLLFQSPPGVWLQEHAFPITFQIPAVVIAQFAVTGALAVRTMAVTFDRINPRPEEIARVHGASEGQAFWHICLPQAKRGLIAAAALAWARGFGEFGPVFVFAGTTRMRAEVLPTTVFLELNMGRLEAATAVSLLMLFVAGVILVALRMIGMRGGRL